MHIVVFLTFGASLKLWRDTGLIGRELLVYKKFLEDGHRITLLTYGGESDRECCPSTWGIRIAPVYSYLRRPNSRIVRLIQSFLIPFYFRKVFISADILKTNQMMGSWVPALCKLFFRKKLVIRCGYEAIRNLIRERISSVEDVFRVMFVFLLELVVYWCADRILISSLTDRKFICRTFHIRQDKISLLRNFIDVDLFCPPNAEKKEDALLYIGRLQKRKNVSALIRALEGTTYRLDVIGEGEEKEDLEACALRNKVDVRFLGTFQNDDLPYLINRYPVFVLPSFYENSPKTLLEAMACGSAVIGTDVDGIREVVISGHNGMLCGTDPVSIRNAIRLLMEDKDLRIKLGENARMFIIRNCGLDLVFKKELQLYIEMLNETR